MGFILGPQARAAGYRLFGYDTVGSTNAEGLALARAGDAGEVWFAARQQTAGRGRRARPWQTEPGNLAASILTLTAAEGGVAATLGLVAGLALGSALAVATSAGNDRRPPASDPFRLKWPNDVVVPGGKLAGVLLEAEKLPGGRLAVVTGIGVNVVSAPADTPYPATSLAALGCAVSAETLFVELAEAWVEFFRIWDGGRGLAAIRDRWLARAAGLGEPIAVRSHGAVVRGVFETIDSGGHLVLRCDDGETVRIAAGDVHFGSAATVPATPPAA